MYFIRLSFFFFVLFLLIQCDEKSTDNVNAVPEKSSDSLKILEEKKKEEISISYHPEIINHQDSALAEFQNKYSEEEIHAILAINRLDFKNRWRADTLVVPDKIVKDFNAYSPFPKYVSEAKNINKLALFSYPIHAYALYENGNLIKWGPTSMGKKSSPTKIGLGFTNWKKKIAISTSNSEWKLRWNFNVFNFQGIGWHQYDLPGYHASHSCMRLLEEDVLWMYTWGEQWILDEKGTKVIAKGTPVIIFGEPDFKSKPWKDLLKSSKANDYSEAQINNEIKPFLEEIIKQQDIRKDYLQSKRDSL